VKLTQLTEEFSLQDIAAQVAETAKASGLSTKIESLPNPRVEAEDHYYRTVHTRLPELGLEPHALTGETIARLLELAAEHLDRVDPSVLAPRVEWRRIHNTVRSQP
jgi:UDP-sulfoquinovose synthase